MSRKLFTALATALSIVGGMLAAAGGAGAAVSAGNTGWYWANPLPQGNTLVRIEASGGRLWAGGATGTLIHSDDAGVSWTAVRTGLLDEIRTIDAISPTSVVFAGKCALRRSDDSGQSVRRLAWGSNDDTCSAQIQAVSFPNPLLGYLLLTSGDIYVSSDGGESWKKQSVVPGAPAQAVHDLSFTSSSTGVVSVGDRILQTVDAGVSWTPVKTISGGSGLMNFEFLNGSVGYAAGDHTDLLKTVDGGTTWNAVAGDNALRLYSVTGISCGSEQQCVASLATNNSVLSTVDGGATWQAALAGLVPVNATAFVSSTRVVAVGQDGLTNSSDDAGRNWGYGSSQPSGTYRKIRTDSRASAAVFGDAGASARSSDGGKTWQTMTRTGDAALIDVAPVGARRFFALDKAGKLYRSENLGADWKTAGSWKRKRPLGVFAWTSRRVAVAGPAGVSISTNGGAKFRAAAGKGARLTFTAVDRAGKKAVFAYGGRDIAVSKDKGATWSKVNRPRGVRAPFKLEMLDAKYGYVLDANAELFKTTNGGRRWKRIETTGANTAVSMAFGDRKHGYLTDNTGRILATSDAGATWARQYPFYDAGEKSPALVAANSRTGALTLVDGSNKIFWTQSIGRIGKPSKLTIKPSATKVRSGTVVRVTGKLSPATGIEQVTVLARVVGARGGTKWVSQQRPVSATGTFTSPWKITATTEFIARWSGDASHDGDAAPIRIVKLRK